MRYGIELTISYRTTLDTVAADPDEALDRVDSLAQVALEDLEAALRANPGAKTITVGIKEQGDHGS